jgi:hypothetical protein
MMGPLLRRKKVVSLPLLGSQGNDFFFADTPRPHQDHHASASKKTNGKAHKREDSRPPGQHKPQRKMKKSFMDNLIRRKQVALDLYAPSQAVFFKTVRVPSKEEETERPVSIKQLPKKNQCLLLPRFTKKSLVFPSKKVWRRWRQIQPSEAEEKAEPPAKLLLSPQFSPPVKGGRGGHSHGSWQSIISV